MIAVADTSPLNYLALIDEIDVLPHLFAKVLLPLAVLQELQHPRTPLTVRQWTKGLPPWLEVQRTASISIPALMTLDPGEREAINLALDLKIDTVLLDESAARRAASLLHLEARGTLGILERGARLGKLNLRQALNKLELTNFRISPQVYAAFLERNL